MAMIKCPECGYEMNGNELNCPNCGCPFTEWTEQNNVPLYKSTSISDNTQKPMQTEKKKPKRFVVSITFSVIIIVLGVLCVSFWRKAKKREDESAETLEDTVKTENSSIDLENYDLSESEDGFTHTETGYENMTEQKSEQGSVTVYWFMPSRFARMEDGLYYAPDYPNDSANINVMEAQDDQVTFQYTQNSFCEAIEYLYAQSYGYDVDVNCTEFTKSEMSGCNTLLIRASYNLLGMEIEQIQFAVEVEKNKVTTITYSHQSGDLWTDAFNLCIESVRIENKQKETDEEISEGTQSEAEITFRDIPWGTTFSDVDSILAQLDLWNISGESYKEYSVDEILIGDYKGIDFDYSDINVISMAWNGEQEVAGYKTSEISLYFSYVPVDGYLTYSEDDSVLYGAQYKFEPTDLYSMYEDLSEKLASLYGAPYKTSEDSDIWGNKYIYTYWLGANDTELVLRATDSSEDTTDLYNDEIYISYAWRYGDVLLQNASDAIKRERLDAEADAQESGITDGL